MIPLADGNFSRVLELEAGMKRKQSRLIATLTNGEAGSKKAANKRGVRARSKVSPEHVHRLVTSLVGDHMHAKRVLSLSSGVIGTMHAASLGVHAIGLGLADVVGLEKKHAVKQIDRLVSNRRIVIWDEFAYWVPFVLGARKDAVVALDWTDFDADDQTTLCLNVITDHGRATPLMWMTVKKSALAEQRNAYEDKVLERLAEVVPADVDITIIADRGFGDQARYEHIESLGFKFIIRFREGIHVTPRDGQPCLASELVPPGGRALMLKDVEVTHQRTPLPAVVLVKARNMKDAWCLATNRCDMTARQVVETYGRRFTIEETFRDTKDIRFGFGMSSSRISIPERRDRLFFISAIAFVLLTLLGAAGEALGLDRYLKVNTSKKRQLSLPRQGSEWYTLIPMMERARLRKLMAKFGEMIEAHVMCRRVVGVV